MACPPTEPTGQLPLGVSVVAAASTRRLKTWSVLERLDGFMNLANLAAEVCLCSFGSFP